MPAWSPQLAPDPGSFSPYAQPQLPLARYRFRFRLTEPRLLHRFTGSAWRGLFGHALKRVVCAIRNTECPACLAYRTCPYPYVFETPPPPDAEKMRRYPSAPHPFAISTPLPPPKPIERYELGITLFGRANHYLAYITLALQEVGSKGLWSKVQLELEGVDQEPQPGSPWEPIRLGESQLNPFPPCSPIAPSPPPQTRVHLLTPLRLRHNDRYVTPERFHFSDLFRNLLRRISLISYFHTDQPLEAPFRELVEQSQRIEITDPQLRWLDWKRYSSRQEAVMEMGGLVGSFTVATGQLGPLWPYLFLGQWTQAGKGTSMGLGQYVLEPLPPGPHKLAVPGTLTCG